MGIADKMKTVLIFVSFLLVLSKAAAHPGDDAEDKNNGKQSAATGSPVNGLSRGGSKSGRRPYRGGSPSRSGGDTLSRSYRSDRSASTSRSPKSKRTDVYQTRIPSGSVEHQTLSELEASAKSWAKVKAHEEKLAMLSNDSKAALSLAEGSLMTLGEDKSKRERVIARAGWQKGTYDDYIREVIEYLKGSYQKQTCARETNNQLIQEWIEELEEKEKEFASKGLITRLNKLKEKTNTKYNASKKRLHESEEETKKNDSALIELANQAGTDTVKTLVKDLQENAAKRQLFKLKEANADKELKGLKKISDIEKRIVHKSLKPLKDAERMIIYMSSTMDGAELRLKDLECVRGMLTRD